MYDVFCYLSIFVAVMSITLYLIVFKIFNKIEGTPFITTASNLSFGIYLIHIIVMRDFVWRLDCIYGISNYILQTILVIVITYISSFTLVYIISLIPGSAYIIGYSNKK